MLIKNAAVLAYSVRTLCEQRRYIPEPVFSRMVVTGINAEHLDDAEEETMACASHVFDTTPGGTCYTYGCRCQRFFPPVGRADCKPYAVRSAFCRGKSFDYADDQGLACAVNAIVYARTDPPVPYAHAVFALAGLPFDADKILSFFLDDRYKGMRSEHTLGADACAIFSLTQITRRGPFYADVLAVTPSIVPYLTPANCRTADYDRILADYKANLEVR